MDYSIHILQIFIFYRNNALLLKVTHDDKTILCIGAPSENFWGRIRIRYEVNLPFQCIVAHPSKFTVLRYDGSLLPRHIAD